MHSEKRTPIGTLSIQYSTDLEKQIIEGVNRGMLQAKVG